MTAASALTTTCRPKTEFTVSRKLGDCYIHNLIARDTIDEWVDVLLAAKYRAAQLAQGDINISTFHESFRSDVSEVLRVVLFPDGSSREHPTTRQPKGTAQ